MIALCLEHHKLADSGGLGDIDDLKKLKNCPNTPSLITKKFSWILRKPLVRLGGGVYDGSCMFRVGGRTLLSIAENVDSATFGASFPMGDGLGWKTDSNMSLSSLVCSTPNLIGSTCFSFALDGSNGASVASMANNQLDFSTDIFDIVVAASGNRIKVWQGKLDIGFEFKITRKNLVQIENLLTKDGYCLPIALRSLVPQGQQNRQEKMTEIYDYLAKIFEESEVSKLASGNSLSALMIRWMVAHRIGKDKKVPVLDLINCNLPCKGGSIKMRNGYVHVKTSTVDARLSQCSGGGRMSLL